MFIHSAHWSSSIMFNWPIRISNEVQSMQLMVLTSFENYHWGPDFKPGSRSEVKVHPVDVWIHMPVPFALVLYRCAWLGARMAYPRLELVLEVKPIWTFIYIRVYNCFKVYIAYIHSSGNCMLLVCGRCEFIQVHLVTPGWAPLWLPWQWQPWWGECFTVLIINRVLLLVLPVYAYYVVVGWILSS